MGVCGSVAMLGLAVALAHAPARSVVLTIDITQLVPMPDAQLRTMVSETDALWTPHGVVFTWLSSAAADPLPLDVVRVLSDGCRVVPLCPPAGARASATRAASTRRLGAVVFHEESAAPENTLLLSVEAVVQVVDQVKWQNRSLVDLPADTRSYLIGRALGRVLAHEIGHYLLAWRFHTRDGLMRPEFRADQLIALSRQEFRLSETQVPSLRLRLARLAARPRELARNRDSFPSQPEP